MKHKLYLLAAVAALALYGCQQPTAPTQVFVTQTQTVTIEGNEQPGSQSGGGSGCAVARLAGGIFGDAGGSACSGRISGQLKVGCEVHFTVTPKLADGTDAPPGVHGQALVVSETVGAERVVKSEDSSNVFNVDLTGASAGAYQLTATLTPPGCSSLQRSYDFNVQP